MVEVLRRANISKWQNQNQNQNQNNFIFGSIQHTETVMYIKKRHNYMYADMEAPTKTISGRYQRATRKINYTDHK